MMMINLRYKFFKVLQVIAVSFFILPPFIITSNGNNAIRFSFKTLELYFFNHVFHFNQFFTISIFIIMCVFLFILFTQVFGRLWCGWLCPQSVLLSIIDTGKKLFKVTNNRIVEIILSAIMALFLTLSLLFFFVSPYNFLNELFGESSYVLIPAFLILFIFMFLDFVFFRYRWCKMICPYARLQSIMSDTDTLFIGMNKDAESECIKCKACIRICPVEIDPRLTPNGECIYCEKCIIACEKSLSKKGKHTILDYNWGKSFKFQPFRVNVIITFIMSVALLIYFLYLTFFNAPINIEYTALQYNNDNSKYSMNINFKNRTDSSVMVNLSTVDNLTIIPSMTILRARQSLSKRYDLDLTQDQAKDTQLILQTDNGYKKIINLSTK